MYWYGRTTSEKVCFRSVAFAAVGKCQPTQRPLCSKSFSFVLRSLKEILFSGDPSGAPCNKLRIHQLRCTKQQTYIRTLFYINWGHPFFAVVVLSPIRRSSRKKPTTPRRKKRLPVSRAVFLLVSVSRRNHNRAKQNAEAPAFALSGGPSPCARLKPGTSPASCVG